MLRHLSIKGKFFLIMYYKTYIIINLKNHVNANHAIITEIFKNKLIVQ